MCVTPPLAAALFGSHDEEIVSYPVRVIGVDSRHIPRINRLHRCPRRLYEIQRAVDIHIGRLLVVVEDVLVFLASREGPGQRFGNARFAHGRRLRWTGGRAFLNCACYGQSSARSDIGHLFTQVLSKRFPYPLTGFLAGRLQQRLMGCCIVGELRQGLGRHRTDDLRLIMKQCLDESGHGLLITDVAEYLAALPALVHWAVSILRRSYHQRNDAVSLRRAACLGFVSEGAQGVELVMTRLRLGNSLQEDFC